MFSIKFIIKHTITVIITGYGPGDSSSNDIQGCLHFTSH